MDRVIAASGNLDVDECKVALQAYLRPSLREPLAPALVAGVTALVGVGGGLNGAATSLVCIEYLLDSGACLDARKEGGGTALMIAAEAGRQDAVKLMLNHWSRVDNEGDGGGSGGPEVINAVGGILLRLNPRHQLAPLLFTALTSLVETGDSTDAAGFLDRIKDLLESGACLDARKEDGGETALMIAAEAGRQDAVELMLAHWSRVDIEFGCDRSGGPEILLRLNAPLLFTAMTSLVETDDSTAAAGFLDRIKDLLESGACLDARKEDGGKTTLMIAAEAGRQDAVELMLAHWSRVDIEFGCDRSGGPEVINAKVEIARNNVAAVTTILTSEPPSILDAKNNANYTVLMIAVQSAGLPIITAILDADSDSDNAHACPTWKRAKVVVDHWGLPPSLFKPDYDMCYCGECKCHDPKLTFDHRGTRTESGFKIPIRDGHLESHERTNEFTKEKETFNPNQIFTSPTIKVIKLVHVTLLPP
eukprot:gene5700-28341_t